MIIAKKIASGMVNIGAETNSINKRRSQSDATGTVWHGKNGSSYEINRTQSGIR